MIGRKTLNRRLPPLLGKGCITFTPTVIAEHALARMADCCVRGRHHVAAVVVVPHGQANTSLGRNFAKTARARLPGIVRA